MTSVSATAFATPTQRTSPTQRTGMPVLKQTPDTQRQHEQAAANSSQKVETSSAAKIPAAIAAMSVTTASAEGDTSKTSAPTASTAQVQQAYQNNDIQL